MNLENIYINIKKIIDEELLSSQNINFEIKNDNSIVTSIDKNIEIKIIEYYLKLEPINPVIISEEYNPDNKLKNLKNKDFLIIDPIDGTENFFYTKNNFGCAISGRIKNIDFDILYTPFDNTFLTRNNFKKNKKAESKINYYSTATIGLNNLKINQISQIRVIGSSVTMFSYFLRGKANSFNYESGCKLWDCYTGLRLSSLNKNIKIDGITSKWFDDPTFSTKFKVYYND